MKIIGIGPGFYIGGAGGGSCDQAPVHCTSEENEDLDEISVRTDFVN